MEAESIALHSHNTVIFTEIVRIVGVVSPGDGPIWLNTNVALSMAQIALLSFVKC